MHNLPDTSLIVLITMTTTAHAPSRPPALRDQILQAARIQLAASGPATLSIRAVARSVGISHQATKHHFGDRAGLLTALATSGFHELAEALDTAIAGCQTATDQIAEIGIAYIRFAREHRSLFALMYDDTAIHPADKAIIAARHATWTRLGNAIQAATTNGWGGGVSPEQLTIAAWAAAHGLATLEPGSLRHLTNEHGIEQILELLTQALKQTR